jgi:hypothetical protein
MPLGFRSPDAKIRDWPVFKSISWIAARPSSLSSPFSPTLLFEPAVA